MEHGIYLSLEYLLPNLMLCIFLCFDNVNIMDKIYDIMDKIYDCCRKKSQLNGDDKG